PQLAADAVVAAAVVVVLVRRPVIPPPVDARLHSHVVVAAAAVVAADVVSSFRSIRVSTPQPMRRRAGWASTRFTRQPASAMATASRATHIVTRQMAGCRQ